MPQFFYTLRVADKFGEPGTVCKSFRLLTDLSTPAPVGTEVYVPLPQPNRQWFNVVSYEHYTQTPANNPNISANDFLMHLGYLEDEGFVLKIRDFQTVSKLLRKNGWVHFANIW